jgi:cysteinyl-tRNA synthetase
MRYLGETIDVHGGGTDLIYPHHESEIAQSECYSGQPFVRYWMHVGMLRYQGEKMSKSLGNLVMAPQLLETYTPDAIRICLMSQRYRESWEYEDSAMPPAQQLADDLNAAANDASGGSGRAIDPGDARRRFEEALDDDLDTPAALEALRILMGDIRDGEERGYDIREAQATLRELTGVLGLTLA